MTFVLHVAGLPIPQGSKSVDRRGFMYEANKRTGPWRKHVKERAQSRRAGTNHVMYATPVSVRLTFVLPRPKSHWRTGRNAGLLRDGAPRYPGVKPDVDKLVRAIFDALTAADVWRDDCLVVHLTATKRYPMRTTDEEQPGVYIEVTEANGH